MFQRILIKKVIYVMTSIITCFVFLTLGCLHKMTPSVSDSKKSKNKLPPVYAFASLRSSKRFLENNMFSLDENGILLTDYRNNYKKLGKIYNPLFISVYANILYREFFKGDKKKKYDFLRQAEWLIDNCLEKNGIIVWEYRFPSPKFKAEPPWISGLTQGVILGILTRANAITGEKKYLTIALKVFKSFTINMNQGGVQTPISDEICFYEEVAKKGIQSAKILNGHIGALVGLWDYYQYTKKPEVKKAFDKGVRGVIWGLEKFDAKGTSYYCLNPKIIAPLNGYNFQHQKQLEWLHQITKNPTFLKYATRFKNYRKRHYEVKVKGSTDPIKHGKDNLYLQFGNQYWSHNKFPTWVELNLRKINDIKGFTIFSGRLEKAFPKDFDILFSKNGKNWKKEIQIRNNSKRVKYLKVKNIHAQFIKIVIFNDNGNRNVVLTGFGIEYKDK